MTHTQGVAVPREHAVHYYADDHEAATALVRFVVAGLAREEHVLVVATAPHLAAVADTLAGISGADDSDFDTAGLYRAVPAVEALEWFMVDGAPDPQRFRASVGALVEQAAAGRPVRVYGEMVSVLWAQGNVAGALALEELWNDLRDTHTFSLLCGYHVSSLRDAGLDDVRRVCELHASVHAPASYESRAGLGLPDAGSQEYAEVFLPVAQAVPAVRRFVTGALHVWDLEMLVGDARLVASELGTNALVHGSSPFKASVRRIGSGVRISVHDLGSGVPELLAETVDGIGGRGVAIIDQLASRWGCDQQSDGKVSWAELHAPSSAG